MQLVAVLVLVLLAGLQDATAARRLRQARESGHRTYETLEEAASKETWLFQQLSGGGSFSSNSNLMEWSRNDEFKLITSIATNPRSKGTVFLPGPVEAYEKQAAAQCLTVQEAYNLLARQPKMPADYIMAAIVPAQALNSSTFWDGQVLRTSLSGVRLQLGRRPRNGTMQWVFRNASTIRIPGKSAAGFPVYEDVGLIPESMDIKAGDAYLHLIDLPIRVDKYEPMWAEKRAEALRNASLPEDSPTCPSRAGSITVALAVGIAVPGGVILVCVGIALLWWAPRRAQSRRHSQHVVAAGVSDVTQGHGSKTESVADASVDVQSFRDQHGVVWSAQVPRSSSSGPPSSGSQVHVQSSDVPSTSVSGSSNRASGGVGALQNTSQGSFAPSAMWSSPFAMRSSAFAMGSPASAGSALQGRGSRWAAGSGGFSRSMSPAIQESLGAAGHGMYNHGAPQPPRAPGSQEALSTNTWWLPAWRNLQQAYTRLAGPPRRTVASTSYRGGLSLTESMPMGKIPSGLVLQLQDLVLEEQPIGAGAEGKVFRGTWKHSDIAAKEYMPDLPTDSRARQEALAKEVHFLQKLKHPNLVTFYGVCLERPMVVMEYYRRGSVYDILRKAEKELRGNSDPVQESTMQELTWEKRLTMLHDVAAGMCYLHGDGDQHIHGDLRSPNLFVGADGKVKIGDFGFTKRLACNERSLTVDRITHPRWVAPELLDNTLKLASDVYSFGVILYELLTFRIPFEGLNKEQVVFAVLEGKRPEVPSENELPPGTATGPCLEAYIQLMQDCWSQDDAARPSFETIAYRLRDMQQQTATTQHTHGVPDMQPALDSEDARQVASAPAGASAAQLQQRQRPAQRQQPSPRPVVLPENDNMSSCVCSAFVVDGTRFAVIAAGADVRGQEALRLANLADHDQIAAAQRVLVIGSDLPSRYP